MDPNSCLERITEAQNTLALWKPTTKEFMEAALELSDAVSDLDTWLTKGGFLPSRWEGKDRYEKV